MCACIIYIYIYIYVCMYVCMYAMYACHVMSCHVMSCHVMSCHVMSCHVMSCHVCVLYAYVYVCSYAYVLCMYDNIYVFVFVHVHTYNPARVRPLSKCSKEDIIAFLGALPGLACARFPSVPTRFAEFPDSNLRFNQKEVQLPWRSFWKLWTSWVLLGICKRLESRKLEGIDLSTGAFVWYVDLV